MSASAFQDKLKKLDGSQQSVQRVSAWLLFHWNKADALAHAWKDLFEMAEPKEMLLMLYLANDALQSRKAHKEKIRAAFAAVLPASFKALTDATSGAGAVHAKAKRLLTIWSDRKVLSATIIVDLERCLSAAPSRKRKRAAAESIAPAEAPESRERRALRLQVEADVSQFLKPPMLTPVAQAVSDAMKKMEMDALTNAMVHDEMTRFLERWDHFKPTAADGDGGDSGGYALATGGNVGPIVVTTTEAPTEEEVADGSLFSDLDIAQAELLVG